MPPTTLREALVKAFSLDELDTLCIDLGFNPEELPNRDGGINIRALRIIKYCNRREILLNLICVCAEKRPNIQWQRLLEAPPAIPPAGEVASSLRRGLAALNELILLCLIRAARATAKT